MKEFVELYEAHCLGIDAALVEVSQLAGHAGFRTEAGFDGLGVRGVLWGGNLCMVGSLLGALIVRRRGVYFAIPIFSSAA